ncbi:MAG: hypothetical protein HIU57_09860, partial [Acidobacteria bacterium]|nr:hypothetical protein [Acidobacteriota bacterium]
MTRRRRCSEPHIRDIDGNILPVAACEAEINGEWVPMASHASAGLTPGALKRHGSSLGVSVRVTTEDHVVETLVDAQALHRRRYADVSPSDGDLAQLSFLEDARGRRLNVEALSCATQRLEMSLSPADLTSFLRGPAAPVIAHVAQVDRPTLEAIRLALSYTEVLDGVVTRSAPAQVVPRRARAVIVPSESLLPQAASASRIAAVVDAIGNSCTSGATIVDAIGMVGRQGAYCPNAAFTLGLVDRVSLGDGNFWDLARTPETKLRHDSAIGTGRGGVDHENGTNSRAACRVHRVPSLAAPPRHLLVANSGERRQTVTKRRDCAGGESPDSTRNPEWSGRRESNSRSQLAVAVGDEDSNQRRWRGRRHSRWLRGSCCCS